MPKRCGCADNCSCLVTAGAGVSVGGIGTVEDPYVVAADEVPLPDSLAFRASDTVTWRTSGAGTPESVMDVYADAQVGMRELTDVLATDVPATGDVVTWQADHWEFRPPPGSTLPGGTTNQVLAKNSGVDGDLKWMTIPSGGGATVVSSNGISGDGSVPTPVALRNSGVWALAGFPPDQSGLTGREVFVDSAGQVRAKPDVIYSTTGKTAAALIGTYPTGLTVMSVTAAQGSGWPPNGSCTVLTARRADGTIGAQWCCLDSGTVSASWYRQGTATAWSPWVALANPLLPDVTHAESGVDINVTSTAANVETNPTVRATVTNPSPYRKMLVDVTFDLWLVIDQTSSTCAVYIDSFLVSGSAAWASVNSQVREQNVGGASLYSWVKMSNMLWVDPGVTVTMGLHARRLYNNVPVTLRGVRHTLTPLRYG
jgi:hypothetical protein